MTPKCFEEYLAEPNVALESDPIEWWRMNWRRFGSLGDVAFDMMSACASSISSEQANFRGKQLITNQRTRLAPETIRSCLCLQSWGRNLKLFFAQDLVDDNEILELDPDLLERLSVHSGSDDSDPSYFVECVAELFDEQ